MVNYYLLKSKAKKRELQENSLMWRKRFFLLQYEDVSSFNSFSLFCRLQADGLKEGDYIIAVGDTECKWMGVSDVMRLLKDVDEEGVDIQVVSMMDSNPAMVCKALILSLARRHQWGLFD